MANTLPWPDPIQTRLREMWLGGEPNEAVIAEITRLRGRPVTLNSIHRQVTLMGCKRPAWFTAQRCREGGARGGYASSRQLVEMQRAAVRRLAFRAPEDNPVRLAKGAHPAPAGGFSMLRGR